MLRHEAHLAYWSTSYRQVNKPNMKAGHIIRASLGMTFAVFFIYLIGKQIQADEIIKAFKHTRPLWIMAALSAFCCAYACRIARWQKMLKKDNPALTWKNCAGPFLASFAANNTLPFRAGDIMRAFSFNTRLGCSSGIVLASLFVERLLDLLMVLLMLVSTMMLFQINIEYLNGLSHVILIGLCLLILLLLLFPQIFTPIARYFCLIIIRFMPKLGHTLEQEINKAIKTITHLSHKSTMSILFAWSGLAWLAEGAVFWCTANALSNMENPLAGWLALPIGTLATLIPSTPGYIGTFDFFTIQAMSTMGNNIAASTAFALLIHLLLWLPPTLSGGLYLLILNFKKSHHSRSI